MMQRQQQCLLRVKQGAATGLGGRAGAGDAACMHASAPAAGRQSPFLVSEPPPSHRHRRLHQCLHHVRGGVGRNPRRHRRRRRRCCRRSAAIAAIAASAASAGIAAIAGFLLLFGDPLPRHSGSGILGVAWRLGRGSVRLRVASTTSSTSSSSCSEMTRDHLFCSLAADAEKGSVVAAAEPRGDGPGIDKGRDFFGDFGLICSDNLDALLRLLVKDALDERPCLLEYPRSIDDIEALQRFGIHVTVKSHQLP
mmetsp:Transcript_9578/g.18765  ORF Transcript_9578/g.18765 Transcript_9578/m.18765 type:complete len:252 (-) Transcript_9578:615-1370(-)